MKASNLFVFDFVFFRGFSGQESLCLFSVRPEPVEGPWIPWQKESFRKG
ncbi:MULTISPECIES: hypothetical protein [Marinobacter]|nr:MULTISPECIES: hypothetical protein [Marinobacter]UZD65051.1 hypothetical protein LJ360_15845 [Marinobacter sp. AN1]